MQGEQRPDGFAELIFQIFFPDETYIMGLEVKQEK